MKTNPSEKLAFPNAKGITFVSPDEIAHCESDGNYTTLYLLDNRQLIVSRQLKEVESALPPEQFLRVHHSHLVRTACVVHYLHQGSQLLLTNGRTVPVARRRKKEVISYFKSV